MNASDRYEPVIGLEVHAQLLTRSKAFCGCSARFGDEPNTNVCPVCSGMPGALPVLNREVVEYALRLGLATNCSISRRSLFARKNYSYPDLPKGFQISQYEDPICRDGFVEIEQANGERKRIGIARIHMEEDAGKLVHDRGGDTLVDLNRCGVPLLEIVSQPDLNSPHEAYLYLRAIHRLVTYLGICNGMMEEGSLRCDANVSVRPTGRRELGTRTELKNMNSFRNVERALEFELKRQMDSLGNEKPILQESMLWDADRNTASAMRGKEEAQDYRYFPEPDLVPVCISAQWIESVRASLVELPASRRDRFVTRYGLSRYDADILTSEKEYADYFEATVMNLGTGRTAAARITAHWVMTEVLRVMGERKVSSRDLLVTPRHLANLMLLLEDGTISGTVAKQVFEEMLSSGEEPQSIVGRKGLMQISDESILMKIVDEVLAKNLPQVAMYREGSEGLLGFFVGEVVKATAGKANPGVVNALVRRRLAVH